jgi:hypothetical protein
MNLTKKDAALGGLVALIFLGGRKVFAQSSTSTAPKANGKHLTPAEDAAHLLKRANQPAAHTWAGVFIDVPVSPLTAQALARWAGLESSGDRLIVSKLGERGLMQAGPDTVKMGGLTEAKWKALIDPSTTYKEQAQIAVDYVEWLWERAARYVASPPVDPVDRIWYAYLYHQRPVDVRDGHLQGPAGEMAQHLVNPGFAFNWLNDAHKLHRLLAANVVAWNSATGAPAA